MIYDCFPFFNELDLLEIRLNVLDPVVDKFVLVEATRTHNGDAKPLYFAEGRRRFAQFADKIIHVVVDDYPPFESAWTYENYQRNCIGRGLAAAKDDDTVLISDLDEIPDPEKVKRHSTEKGVFVFRQRPCCYYFNVRRTRLAHWRYRVMAEWEGTKMLPYREFKTCYDSLPCPDCIFLKPAVNQGTTASKIRFLYQVPCRTIRRGGWHFSSLGGAEVFKRKMASYAHQERKHLAQISADDFDRSIASGVDPLNGCVVYACEFGGAYPRYLLENREKFRQYIFALPSCRKWRLRTLAGIVTARAEAFWCEAVWQACHFARRALERIRAVRRRCGSR